MKDNIDKSKPSLLSQSSTRFVLPSCFSWLTWVAVIWLTLAPIVGGESHRDMMESLGSLWMAHPLKMASQVVALAILSASLLGRSQRVLLTDTYINSKQSDKNGGLGAENQTQTSKSLKKRLP